MKRLLLLYLVVLLLLLLSGCTDRPIGKVKEDPILLQLEKVCNAHGLQYSGFKQKDSYFVECKRVK